MDFGASDSTRPGTYGASYLTYGASGLQMDQERFEIMVSVYTGYYADSHVGADRPGGEGGARVSSIFEFVMPAENLDWFYDLRITENRYFTGSTLVTVENLTQSMMLLELSWEVRNETTTLIGDIGDVIRISTQMSGGGSVPDEVMGLYGYDSSLWMTFTVPEPATLTLLVLGAVLGMRRGKTDSRSRKESDAC